MSGESSNPAIDHIGIVRAFGLVFNNTSLYSAQHSVTKQAVDDCYTLLHQQLQIADELLFAVSDDNLMVNSTHVELTTPLMKMVVTTLAELEIGSFSISTGIDREEFDKLVDVLNSKPEDLKAFGGFGEAIATFSMAHIKATTVTIMQVTEDETIVSLKDDEKTLEQAVDSITSFLRSDQGEDNEQIVEQLKDFASRDADKLSELIIDSAGKGGDEVKPEESSSDEVIDSIRRVYDAIAQDPSFKTQKGKKELKKALQALEESILARLKAGESVMSDADFLNITDAFEQLNDEIEIEGLATEYLKKRSAISTNENRILRFIRAKGLDKISDSDLEGKLRDGGLSLEGWQELLMKSGIGDDLGEEGTGIAAVGHLTMLLDQMESSVKAMKDDVPEAEEAGDKEFVSNIMGEVDKEVQKMVLRAEKKIQNLVLQVNEADGEEAGDGAKKTSGKPRGLSRKKLLERLAEVVQELCQPLSVINCSIQMIMAGSMGEVTPPQADMLNLADESTRKVQVLIDHLLDLSGVPRTLQPDQQIQKSLYE